MSRRFSARLLIVPILTGVVVQLVLFGLLLWQVLPQRPITEPVPWLWQILLSTLLITLLGSVSFALLTYQLVGGVSELLGRTRLISAGHYRSWTPTSRFTELVALGNELNRLSHALQAHARAQQFNQQRLRDFAEVNADWLWELDDNLRFSYASGRPGAPPGIPSREILGRSWQDVLQQMAVEPAAWQACQTHFERRQALVDLEIAWRTPAGTTHTLLINARPVLDQDNAFCGYRGVGRDITRRKQVEEALKASEAFSQTIFNSLNSNIAVLDSEGVIVAVNHSWEQFARDNGVAEPAVVGVGVNYFQVCRQAQADIAVAAECLAGMQAVLEGQAHFETIYPCHSPTHKRWFLLRALPLLRGQRELVVVHIDITERWLATEQNHLMTRVFENTADGIMITDSDQRIQWVNPAFQTITGYSAAEVVGQTPALLRSDQHDADFFQAMWTSLQDTDQWQGEISNRRKDGTLYPGWLRISALRDENRELSFYVGVFTDITTLRAHEAQLAFLAYHDPLTELANRALFQQNLAEAVQRAERYRHGLAVLFIDLDGFKAVNDSMGHDAGDRLLQTVAQRLHTDLRKTDTLARLGGDEFAILLDQLSNPQDIAGFASKILDQLTSPISLDGQTVFISGSIGISCYPDDGHDAEMLLKNADTAMYRAKEISRNCFCFFSTEMGIQVRSRLAQHNELRAALANQELLLHYQPTLDLQDNHITRLEALVRWQPPGGPLRGPPAFIPLAEGTGLIAELDDWVFRNACQQFRQWREAGLSIPRLAINLSARQLPRADLAQRLAEILRQTGMDATEIDLEITETATMHPEENYRPALESLKALGFTITIDHFGAGASSLSYLRRCPIDQIKIHREFVAQLPHDEDSAIIVRSIITLAQGLGLRVIADGVETSAQQDFLRDARCDEIQGYLISEPVPATHIPGLWYSDPQPGDSPANA